MTLDAAPTTRVELDYSGGERLTMNMGPQHPSAHGVFRAILTLEGETTVEGPLVGRLIGLGDVRATLAMLRTPDGQGIELDKFHTPDAIRFGPVNAPVNTLGLRRVMFAVDDIDAVVARMCAYGAELIGEMHYENSYRLAYIRGPEGIIVALAEQIG